MTEQEYEIDYCSRCKKCDGSEYHRYHCIDTDIIEETWEAAYQQAIDDIKKNISEEELDNLATNWNVNYAIHPHMEDYEKYYEKDVVDAFKYGYKKAKEL